ncbi:carboxymuconolactone decarboxylase family protein [Marinactinospora rubrisoli]|uniref:Carboxymuconolactone decarboxylase family protein n=1 Tax=Marinactinospora rubrisoli TaxID=2715399 RepID=A0ABW2KHP4_9ACTN
MRIRGIERGADATPDRRSRSSGRGAPDRRTAPCDARPGEAAPAARRKDGPAPRDASAAEPPIDTDPSPTSGTSRPVRHPAGAAPPNRTRRFGTRARAAHRRAPPGGTPPEIQEVFLQAAVYCGVPAANTAFGVAQRVLAEPDES